MGFGNALGSLESMIPGAASAIGQAPQEGLATALTHAFQSDQTPPFGQMVSSLFGQSSNEQKAGFLNQLIGSVGPQMLQSGALGGLGSLLGGASQVTPDQAAQVNAGDVQQMAEQAQQHNPSIVEAAGSFFAQHPALVQGLGAASLAFITSHLSKKS